MDTSRGLPTDRLAIGQLLLRLLGHFRRDLFEQAADDGRFVDLRFSHLQIWGNVGIDGIRLTTLADRANLGLPACSALVDELQRLGYLTRRPDPTDRRAKLIFPTAKGRRLLDAAGTAVAQLEDRWRQLLAPDAFDRACSALDDLLAALDETDTPEPRP